MKQYLPNLCVSTLVLLTHAYFSVVGDGFQGQVLYSDNQSLQAAEVKQYTPPNRSGPKRPTQGSGTRLG